VQIGEVASAVGVKTSTIRYYESIGLIPAPPRVSGRRRYGPEVMERLRIIAMLQQVGFRLREIRRLMAGMKSPSTRWRSAAAAKLAEIDANVAQLRRARRLLADAIDCACEGRPQNCKLLQQWQSPGRSERRPRLS
jgi:MerR family redox-sensitive transcriptional activator SoxR